MVRHGRKANVNGDRCWNKEEIVLGHMGIRLGWGWFLWHIMAGDYYICGFIRRWSGNTGYMEIRWRWQYSSP